MVPILEGQALDRREAIVNTLIDIEEYTVDVEGAKV